MALITHLACLVYHVPREVEIRALDVAGVDPQVAKLLAAGLLVVVKHELHVATNVHTVRGTVNIHEEISGMVPAIAAAAAITAKQHSEARTKRCHTGALRAAPPALLGVLPVVVDLRSALERDLEERLARTRRSNRGHGVNTDMCDLVDGCWPRTLPQHLLIVVAVPHLARDGDALQVVRAGTGEVVESALGVGTHARVQQVGRHKQTRAALAANAQQHGSS